MSRKVSKFQSVLDVARDESGEAPTAGIRAKRRRGKRRDPDYQQITAYIRKDTHLKVKIALLEKERGKEFSELLEELLDGWLASK